MAKLPVFDQLKLAMKLPEGLEVGAHINEQDRQERQDDEYRLTRADG